MKNSDIAMIIFIVAVSVMGSYFVVGTIPALKDTTKPVNVKIIEKYNANIKDVDTEIFSKDAINPTIEVTIGSGG